MKAVFSAVSLLLAAAGTIGDIIPATAQGKGHIVQSNKANCSKAAQKGQQKMGKDSVHLENFSPPAGSGGAHGKLLDDSSPNGDKGGKSEPSTQGDQHKVSSMGEARLEADGSITLNLRSDAYGLPVHGRFNYKPNGKDYADVMEHLHGLKPGEVKQVPPWPDPQELQK
jgi:hypothetical protein